MAFNPLDEEWPKKAADTVDAAVQFARRKFTTPIVKVTNAIVYSLQDDRDLLNEMLPVRPPDGFNQNNGTRLAEYTIGNNGDVYADGTARLIKAGSKIHFNAHYHSYGEEVKDRIRVGVTGAQACAFRASTIEAALQKSWTPQAAQSVQLASADMMVDIHAGAAYRAALVSTLAARAVQQIQAKTSF